MKKVISIILMIIIAFRNIPMTVYGEENINLTILTIPIISNSQINKIDAYVNMNTLENNTEIFITINDFAILTQMEEIINNETNTAWNKGFNYFVLDKQRAIIKAYYIISTDTIIDIKEIIVSKEIETFECQYINNTYYIDMQSIFQYLHVDYDCNFEINSDQYIAINCIDTLDILQKEYISNLNLYRYSYIVDKDEVNKSKGIKILDENGLDIVGLVYDLEKERENISIDEYYKCLNVGLAEEGLEWLDYESDYIEYVILDKKLQKGADKFQQSIIDEIKSIDSNTLKSVGTLESIVNGIGNIITVAGIAIDALEVEVEREQEKYIIESIFNDIKKTEYTQEYFSLLSNSILQEYQYYAIEDNIDINNIKEFSEYMKNHKYTYRNGVRYNDTDIIRNTAILLYSDFYSFLNGEEYARHIDINAFIDHYFNIMETTINLGFNLDSTEVASQYAVANDCYYFFIENNKDEFTWWQSLTDYSDNIITSYNFYNLRNAFLNTNPTSNVLSKDSLIGSQKMELMMLKALLKASESNPEFINDSQKQEIETSLKASSNLLFRLENCVVTNENNLAYKSIYDNSNNNKMNSQNCSWLLDMNNSYEWHLSPTIEAEDIINSDEDSHRFGKLKKYHYPSDEYSVIKQNGKYGIIKYDGTYYAEAIYDVGGFGVFDEDLYVGYNYSEGYSSDDIQDIVMCPDESQIKISNFRGGRGIMEHKYIYNKANDKIYYLVFASDSPTILNDDNSGYSDHEVFVVEQYNFDITKNNSKRPWELTEQSAPKFGISNKTDILVPCEYDNGCMNDSGEIVALEKDGKWGFFNKNGKQIIDFVCDSMENKRLFDDWCPYGFAYNQSKYPYLATEGYIPVKINGKCGYYDTQGNEIIPCGTFEEVRPVHNGLAWVKQDGKWGVIKLKNIETEINTSNNSEELFTGTVNTEKDPLNVRKSPSTEAKIIGKIDKGSTVTIYSENGDWYEIEYNGGVGYVSKKYIRNKDNNSDEQTSSISDSEILKAVNNYLKENQSKLGIWLSDGDPYCPAEHMRSNNTKWSCPINLNWDSYSANEIAGAYPHFAYVDKKSLKCTITADYETVVEFELMDYTLTGNSPWTSEQIINSINAYLKENWCGENQYYCFESELMEHDEKYWSVCIRWDGSNSANVMTGNDCRINKETGDVEISFMGEPYEWFNIKDYK